MIPRLLASTSAASAASTSPLSARRRHPLALAAPLALVLGSVVALAGGTHASAATPAATTCSAVDVSFARGTGEPAGLGTVGTPFTTSLRSDLGTSSVSVYAVNYAANVSQSSAAPGSADLVNHVTSVAASCPSTVFVLGGYSQGASVVDYALGLFSGGTVLPSSLAPRVKAIVVFGNPLGLERKTIETASPTYGAAAKSYCNTGDPVCGNGFNVAAHLQYATNGSTTTGAQFAATKVTG